MYDVEIIFGVCLNATHLSSLFSYMLVFVYVNICVNAWNIAMTMPYCDACSVSQPETEYDFK